MHCILKDMFSFQKSASCSACGKTKGGCKCGPGGDPILPGELPTPRIDDLDAGEFFGPPLRTPAEPAPDENPFIDDDQEPALLPPGDARWCPGEIRMLDPPEVGSSTFRIHDPSCQAAEPARLVPRRQAPAELPPMKGSGAPFRPVVLQEDYIPKAD
jgi:hypothetical protein